MATEDTRDNTRLMDIELKVLDLEHTIDQLNEVVVRQQAQIDRLVRELQSMAQRLPSNDAPGFRSLRDDLPPHY